MNHNPPNTPDSVNDDDQPPASVLQVSRDHQLHNIRRTQPYDVELDGLQLHVAKDVFPPDFGFTSRFLAKTLAQFSPQSALDMGTGSGYLALILSKRGVPVVWALDIHEPAVQCARQNAAQNGLNVNVAQSDLFSAVPVGQKFDLIVFNQPYYPATGEVVFGLGADGGREIIRRFMSLVKGYLTPTGTLVMPFSDMAGEEHHPVPIVSQYGFSSREIFHHFDGTYNHMIYAFNVRP